MTALTQQSHHSQDIVLSNKQEDIHAALEMSADRLMRILSDPKLTVMQCKAHVVAYLSGAYSFGYLNGVTEIINE